LDILNELELYKPDNKIEKEYKKMIIEFINNNNICLGSKNPNGHLTASAWIVNYDRNKTLLHNHIAFNKWIQLGGHTEDNENIMNAALREAREESGLSSLEILSDNIFDIDVHKIPARGHRKEHYHYDIRYILEASDSEKIKKSHESNKIEWLDRTKIDNYTTEESVLRMVRKTLNTYY
jgi:8-oxo-dGTP pyrophosphatase MutT (NUDIX family)